MELVQDRDLKDHVREFDGHLIVNDAVLLVSHSQGNMYAAYACQLLAEKYDVSMSFRINPIASPVYDVLPDDYFTTAFRLRTGDWDAMFHGPYSHESCSKYPSHPEQEMASEEPSFSREVK
jgi:hypothetical protein